MKNVLSFLLMFVAVSMATVPTTGLVAWYPCDERYYATSPYVFDHSGNNDTLITYGGTGTRVVWTDTGKDSFAINFRNANIPVKSKTVTPFDFQRSFTLSAWVYFLVDVTTPGWRGYTFMVKRNAYHFGLNTTGGLTASFMNPADSGYYGFYTSTSFNVKEWYHVMMTVDLDNSIKALYVNGVKKQLLIYRGVPTSINLSEDSLIVGGTDYIAPTVGRNRGELAGSFPGIMDGIRIYNRALTDAEAMQLYLEYDVAQLNLLLNNFPGTLSVEKDSSFTLPDSTNKGDPITYTSLHLPAGMLMFGSHPKMLIWSGLTGGTTDSIVLVISDGQQTDTVTKVVTITGNSTVLMSIGMSVAHSGISVMTHGNQVIFGTGAGVQVSVYDPTGKKVLINEGKAILNSGMYLYRVLVGKQLCINKFYIK